MHVYVHMRAEAVKHVIGNFPRLFGTDDGRKLQRIAAKRSWPLFWAVGYGDPGKHDKNFSDPGRFPSNFSAVGARWELYKSIESEKQCWHCRGNQRFADPSIAARPAGACRAGRRGGKCQWCQTSTS